MIDVKNKNCHKGFCLWGILIYDIIFLGTFFTTRLYKSKYKELSQIIGGKLLKQL